MTDINPFTNHGGLATTTAQSVAATDITMSILEWAQELDAAGRIASVLCNTEFVPKGLRGSVEATAAAILTGREIGLTPMNALANIFVVQGKPAMYARTMVALVLSHGHEVERTAATEKVVTVRARRKGSQQWQEFTWTIDRAQKAGYTSNALYSKDPIAMLTAKAQTEACRTLFPDVLSGMAATSVEEINLDGVIEVTEDPTPPPAPKRTVQRKPRPAAPAPDLPPVVEDAPAVAVDQDDEPAVQQDEQPPAPKPSSRVQWGKLSNALEAIGVTDKPGKVREMQDWAAGHGKLHRTPASIGDLTADEADRFLAYLEEIAAAPTGETTDWPTQDVAS